ncbi:hypothetical protein N7495_004632 [Penicillium taxi]|uniref:uncharacterized protein n=1 Tax=Penicillium taxi TaxID=168475 RepID=UPI002544D51C|nr:uncharacterized protein N7495_004632 [Penicillium taxi]KAJ5899888.1 hypothetical protein N7495_004632 [Penicillium taxi]
MSSKKKWQFRSSEGFITLVVAIAIFTDAFIYGMIVPVISVVLVDRVGAREEDAQFWVSILLAVYGATLFVGSPLFGYVADYSQRKTLPFVAGLVALAASTGLFVIARSLSVLIIARALQGLSAAAVWVVGLAILADNVPPNRVAEVMGQTTIALTWGLLLGPIVGGVVYEKLGFYRTFIIPVGLTLIDVILRLAMVENPKNLKQDESSQSQFSDPELSVYTSFAGLDESESFYSCAESVIDERTSLLGSSSAVKYSHADIEHKITVLHLLRSPRLPMALLATIIIALVISAVETTLPLFVMDTFHWGSAGAGLMFIATSIPSLAGVFIGKAMNQLGARVLGATALTVSAASWVLMRFVSQNKPDHIILLVVLLFFQGLSIVAIEVIAMTEVSRVIDDYSSTFPGAFGEKSPIAQAYALFNMSFAAGQLIGPILAGVVRVQAGWGTMTLVIGLICALTAVPLGLFSGEPKEVVAQLNET